MPASFIATEVQLFCVGGIGQVDVVAGVHQLVDRVTAADAFRVGDLRRDDTASPDTGWFGDVIHLAYLRRDVGGEDRVGRARRRPVARRAGHAPADRKSK